MSVTTGAQPRRPVARPMGQSNIIEPKLMIIMFIIYIWFVSSIGG